MPEITIAYETYGTLAPDGRNAVLLTHGYTSSQHMAGRYGENGAEGSWDGLVGPGKAIDTNRLFVVSSNMLGSSYGSTNPAFKNPATGKPYGPDFPDITLVDIVTAQKALLDSLGVKHLVAVAGPSFGGYQTYQWGVAYPDFMDGLVPVVSAPKGSRGEAAVTLAPVVGQPSGPSAPPRPCQAETIAGGRASPQPAAGAPARNRAVNRIGAIAFQSPRTPATPAIDL